MSASASVTLSTRIRKRVSGGNRIALLLLRRWDARIALIILSTIISIIILILSSIRSAS